MAQIKGDLLRGTPTLTRPREGVLLYIRYVVATKSAIPSREAGNPIASGSTSSSGLSLSSLSS